MACSILISSDFNSRSVLFVLGTLGYIVLRGLMLSAKCKDPFGSLLLIGISSMIGIQVVINLGGATGLLPITGITLPFISYGGSSLLLQLSFS
ncbi:FtsW/RodA/SpoVE family cell cycle protein [Peribacillus simplex]|nr:FtsW/RodA/SpoVE family cell cycle protein [Peribacillus simplex]